LVVLCLPQETIANVYIESTSPTTIDIRIVRWLVNNFNAVNANTNITTNNIDVTGMARSLAVFASMYRTAHVNHRLGKILKFDRTMRSAMGHERKAFGQQISSGVLPRTDISMTVR
jgi:hypothetical protein